MLDFCAHLADKFGAGALAMPSPDRTLMWSSPMHRPIPELTLEQQRRFWACADVARHDDCWPWLGTITSNGYGQFCVSRVIYLAHRVALAISGENPDRDCGLHTCDNPPCVNPAHLFVGSRTENNEDKRLKGRHSRGVKHSQIMKARAARGEASGFSKLTDNDVIAIRLDNRTHKSIASDYGVSASVITRAKNRITWRHIP